MLHTLQLASDARYTAGGLAFFNCGDASGHSQPHKHVQLVPLPFAQHARAPVPIGPLVEAGAASSAPGEVFSVRALPFRNTCVAWPDAARVTAEQLTFWQASLRDAALSDSPAESYNFLLATNWMIAVPRSAERGLGIAVNALGFAGTMLVRACDCSVLPKQGDAALTCPQCRTLQVRNSDELARVRADPMAVLSAAGVPWRG